MFDIKTIIDRYVFLFCWPIVQGILLFLNFGGQDRFSIFVIIISFTFIMELLALAYVYNRTKEIKLNEKSINKDDSFLKIYKIFNIIFAILLAIALTLRIVIAVYYG